jgi:hypothetical protein
MSMLAGFLNILDDVLSCIPLNVKTLNFNHEINIIHLKKTIVPFQVKLHFHKNKKKKLKINNNNNNNNTIKIKIG